MVASMSEKQLTSSDKLQAAFRMFDKDGSGLVSPSELKEVLGGNVDFSKMITQVDINADGDISYEEFVMMMKKLIN